jgi:hypothetical protein
MFDFLDRAAGIAGRRIFVADVVERELRSAGFGADALGQLDSDSVRLARTASRSILGVMNNAALLTRYQIARVGGINHADVDALNRFLRRTPLEPPFERACRVGNSRTRTSSTRR